MAMFVGLIMSTGSTKVSYTDAAWNSPPQTRTGTFSATNMGPIKDLKCYDHDDGLLGTSLLDGDLILTWSPPENVTGNPISYRIDWKVGGLGGASGQATITDGSNQYRYDSALLTSLLGLRVTFNIYPVAGTWQGTATSLTAKGLGVGGISVTLDCPA